VIWKYELFLSKSAFKFLKKQDQITVKRLNRAIEGIRMVPPEGDVTMMKSYENVFRLRVGSIRIVYEVNHSEKTVFVRTIGYRGDVYKD
jgi:mRNA interferase RelE/StbE